ncbi:MAG: hypothetical protein IH988_07795 [Planctomycetes bacterium]|nr:hypothetical protein [Planctomycetota bacterium]
MNHNTKHSSSLRNPAPQSVRSATRSSAGFWFLIVLASLGFAPCILVPAWGDYAQVVGERNRERLHTEQMQVDVMQLRRTLARIDADPAVTARLSRRELAYRTPGDIIIPVGYGSGSEAMRSDPLIHATPSPVPVPGWLAPVIDCLPDLDYAAVFGHEPTRRMLMCLSAGPLVAAFVLFGWGSGRRPSVRSNAPGRREPRTFPGRRNAG